MLFDGRAALVDKIPREPRLRVGVSRQRCAADFSAIPGSAPGSVFTENALQGAAVHLEPARGFRDIALAQLEHPLDVLPAHPVG